VGQATVTVLHYRVTIDDETDIGDSGPGSHYSEFKGVLSERSLTHHSGDMVYTIGIFGDEKGAQSLQVSGTIRWQACYDDVCHLHKSERFELTIPLQRANAQERHRKEGSTRMDFRHHFARMIERNKDGND
jgi:hypothetical protein